MKDPLRRTSGPARIAPRADAGFTLIEALIVMAVAAVLAAAAVPSFERFVTAGRVAEASSGLRAAFELARSEALARGARVGVCRSGTANAAAPTCNAAAVGTYGATDWAVGWIVYAKDDANAGDVFEARDVLLRRQGPLAAEGGHRVLAWAPAGGPVVYNWNGVRLSGPVGAFSIDHGPIVASMPSTLSSAQASCLSLNMVGRLSTAKPVSGRCP